MRVALNSTYKAETYDSDYLMVYKGEQTEASRTKQHDIKRKNFIGSTAVRYTLNGWHYAAGAEYNYTGNTGAYNPSFYKRKYILPYAYINKIAAAAEYGISLSSKLWQVPANLWVHEQIMLPFFTSTGNIDIAPARDYKLSAYYYASRQAFTYYFALNAQRIKDALAVNIDLTSKLYEFKGIAMPVNVNKQDLYSANAAISYRSANEKFYAAASGNLYFRNISQQRLPSQQYLNFDSGFWLEKKWFGNIKTEAGVRLAPTVLLSGSAAVYTSQYTATGKITLPVQHMLSVEKQFLQGRASAALSVLNFAGSRQNYSQDTRSAYGYYSVAGYGVPSKGGNILLKQSYNARMAGIKLSYTVGNAALKKHLTVNTDGDWLRLAAPSAFIMLPGGPAVL